MANNPKKIVDPTEAALSAIQEALKVRDDDEGEPDQRVAERSRAALKRRRRGTLARRPAGAPPQLLQLRRDRRAGRQPARLPGQ